MKKTMSFVKRYTMRVAAAVALSGVAVTANAGIGDKYARAWVWADQASSTLNQEYIPHTDYSVVTGYKRNPNYPYRTYFGNGAKVTRTGTGLYTVKLVGVDTLGGVSHVTAYGGNHQCKIGSWGPYNGDQFVNVRCYSAAGSLVDGRFVVLYYASGPTSATMSQAYLWADRPANAADTTYVPSMTYQHNSGGSENTVTQLGTGQYRVYMPRVHQLYYNEQGGTVMVTAYGSDPIRCKSNGWGLWGNDAFASVNCYDSNGALANSRFTFSFIKDMGTIGAGVSEDTQQSGYAWIDSVPNPSAYYQENYGDTITGVKLGTGRYRIEVPYSFGGRSRNDFFVTAYGANSNYCSIINWFPSSVNADTLSANVNCYQQGGALSDSQFTIQRVSPAIILY